jgi:hypothetical protein
MEDDRDEVDPFVQLAIQNELLSRGENLQVERLPNGGISISGTVTVPVTSEHPGYLIVNKL